MTREGGFLYGRNPIGRNLREEFLVGGIPFRRNPVWEESSMGWNLCGRNPVGRISVVRISVVRNSVLKNFVVRNVSKGQRKKIE